MTRKQAKRRKPKKARKMPRITLPVAVITRVLIGVLIVFATYRLSAGLLDRPIDAITIDGPFQRVSALTIEEAIAPHLGDGFLSANLRQIRDAVTQLAWIDQASVARRWPATLEIHVTEQVPAACWGDSGLLNTRGELFVTDLRHVPAELPRLNGPDGRSYDVAETYLDLRARLIPLGLDLRRVHMDARGSWEVTLQNGVDVRLGRRDLGERLDLFVDVVANLVSSREAEVDFVDMRYSNGFSIGWAGEEQQAGPAETSDGAPMVAGNSVSGPEVAAQ